MVRVSLKRKIQFLSIGLVCALGITASVLVHNMMSKQKDLTLQGFTSYAQSLSLAIAAQFYERYGDVQAFAVNPVFQGAPIPAIQDALNQYVKLYGIYDLILFIAPNGRLIASNTLAVSGKSIPFEKLNEVDFSKEPWFQAALKGEFSSDKEHGFDGTYFDGPINDPYTEMVSGEKSWVTGFTAPVRNKEGKTIAILSNRANMKWVEGEFINSYLSLVSGGLAKSEMALVDKNGKFIVEHTPDKPEDGDKVKRDWEVLGKKGAREEHPDLWELMTKEPAGGTKLTFDTDLGVNQAAAYSGVTSSKFVKSIGWSVVVMEAENEIFASAVSLERGFFSVFAIMLVVVTFVSHYFSTRFSNELSGTAKTLLDSASRVQGSAKNLSQLSDSLQKVSSSQSTAVQETTATLDEFSAMVEKTSDNASNAQNDVKVTVDATNSGKNQIENMVNAIRRIEQNTTDFAKTTEVSNRDVSAIVDLISEISNKANVINDIVFQTKLLSFNASVEAARAGEYGKGFAVVAEEVGNLAHMSGQSAKEISTLLESSTQKIKQIVETSTKRQNELVQVSTATVHEGMAIAKQCKEAFEAILQRIELANSRTAEIVVAANEQNTGVKEITKAIRVIDDMTQKTFEGANECSSTSGGLNQEASEMVRLLNAFLTFVNGANNKSEPLQPNAGHLGPVQQSNSPEPSGHFEDESENVKAA